MRVPENTVCTRHNINLSNHWAKETFGFAGRHDSVNTNENFFFFINCRVNAMATNCKGYYIHRRTLRQKGSLPVHLVGPFVLVIALRSFVVQAVFDKFAFYDRSRGHASNFRDFVESLLVVRGAIWMLAGSWRGKYGLLDPSQWPLSRLLANSV